MESNRSTTRISQKAEDENEEKNERIQRESNKPLHRFLQRDPRSFGIALVIFGCAELLMEFHVSHDPVRISFDLFIEFCQGALVVISGILSIVTDIYPSKKMVTVCLAIYVVSILGTLLSLFITTFFLIITSFSGYFPDHIHTFWHSYRAGQIICVEAVSFFCTLCVTGLLIFLSTIARLGLKSTLTQIVVQYTPHQIPSETTAE